MNIIFDISHSFHKSFSVFSKQYDELELFSIENQEVLKRKFITDFCYSIRIFESLGIDKVICCFDGMHNWRKNAHKDYKANRSPKPPAFYQVRNACESMLKKAGFIVSKVDMLEADDLMAMWSQFVVASGEQCIIMSTDGDIRQLVNKDVLVYSNNSKRPEVFYTEPQKWFYDFHSSVKLDYVEVTPDFIRFEKTLLGCKGDNVPKMTKFGVGYRKVLDLYNLCEIFLDDYENVFYVCEEEGVFDEDMTLEKFMLNYRLIDLISNNGPLNVIERTFESFVEDFGKFSFNGTYEMKNIYDKD